MVGGVLIDFELANLADLLEISRVELARDLSRSLSNG